jgi:DNA-binding MarR family transcriptional regulator/GNAT superfamily N-acetyltransferase
MAAVDDIRSFNRFYTRQIGLLDEGLSNSPFSLVEARVLYELAQGATETAADLTRALTMDKAHVSRVLSRLQTRGLIEASVSPSHARRRLLSLTDAGRAAFAALEQATRAQMSALIAPLDSKARGNLTGAMRQIRMLLGETTPRDRAFGLRAPRVGDLGFILHRQATLYHEEYGWSWAFEGLVARILSDFVENFDPVKEAAWVADRQGAIVGSIFLVKSETPDTAKLRLLYVEPSARGLGIGAALTAACIARARTNGFKRLALWTNDILMSARRIYQAAGFVLVAEEKHHSFGHDLVGQNWELAL